MKLLHLSLLSTLACVSAVTTTLPASAGVTTVPTAIPISGTFDGGMKRYDRSSPVCVASPDSVEENAIFILQNGATLSNVIIGQNQAEGIICKGTCTLNNVWWANVCEVAATFKHTSGTSFVNGGGAFDSSDNVFLFSGKGTVHIKDFYANEYNKLIRSCGNCKNSGPRNIIVEGSVGNGGGALCGINTNFGDTCKIIDSCQDTNQSCDRYKGYAGTGGEAIKLGSGPDGTYCTTSGFTTDC